MAPAACCPSDTGTPYWQYISATACALHLRVHGIPGPSVWGSWHKIQSPARATAYLVGHDGPPNSLKPQSKAVEECGRCGSHV